MSFMTNAAAIRDEQEKVRRACAALWNRIMNEPLSESERDKLYEQYMSGLAQRTALARQLQGVSDED